MVAGEARLLTGWHANPHLSLVADTSVSSKPDSLWGEAVPRLCSALPVAGVDANSYQARDRLSESVLSGFEPRDNGCVTTHLLNASEVRGDLENSHTCSGVSSTMRAATASSVL